MNWLEAREMGRGNIWGYLHHACHGISGYLHHVHYGIVSSTASRAICIMCVIASFVARHLVKHPAAKGCTDDGTLAIVPIYIPILD
jgi:hypothetical protein